MRPPRIANIPSTGDTRDPWRGYWRRLEKTPHPTARLSIIPVSSVLSPAWDSVSLDSIFEKWFIKTLSWRYTVRTQATSVYNSILKLQFTGYIRKMLEDRQYDNPDKTYRDSLENKKKSNYDY